MSSYDKTVWKDSAETEITAERLNNMEDGIENAHNGENVPDFESYDRASDFEGLYEIETIKKGETLKSILSKITKFSNNIRWLFNFINPQKIQEAGYDSMEKVIERIGNIISSDEVKTTDTYFGKPVYTKTLKSTTKITAGSTNSVPHGISDIDSIWIDLSNSYLNNGVNVFPLNISYYITGFDNCCPHVDKTNIYFASQGTWTETWIKVITLRYTKNTD